MSLVSRILFAGSMLACAALCGWAAVSFGGPAVMPMSIIGGICVVIAVVVWMIKGAKELENVRVEGEREPTFRLKRSEPGFKEEIWQLVLGKTECKLMRPDGTPATTFARKWAETAIKLPGFVSGEMLRIVREDWSPPDAEHWLARDLTQAAKSLTHAAGDVRPHAHRYDEYYWFSPSKEVIEQIENYKKESVNELGIEAAAPLLIKARQCILTGLLGLAGGIGLFVYRFMTAEGLAAAPANSGTKAMAFAGVVSLIGVWRIGQGFLHYSHAGRIARDARN
jgi:hypothetical protein